jgi:hypothetical protein
MATASPNSPHTFYVLATGQQQKRAGSRKFHNSELVFSSRGNGLGVFQLSLQVAPLEIEEERSKGDHGEPQVP